MAQNYKAVIQYDGSEFYGWQIQRNHATVQGTVRRAIQRIASEEATVIGSGRTDSGVHAEGQVASFVLQRPFDPAKLQRALNAVLPESIRIVRLGRARPAFHPQFGARRKIYWYRIWNAPVIHPFWRKYALHVPQKLDAEAMAQAARWLVGRHDFRAFAASSSTAQTFQRHVSLSAIRRRGAMLVYQVAADGFLHHMVRNIAGTLLLVGRARLTVADVRAILESRDRRRAGPRAPAHGLTLKRVIY
ncbi:MAG: tRNA pseudouridine(38-40) synthase TruA [Acidobacteria bacterium]|nr:tRNA pseudouridine(38-40) synthase TruA [Acidobacteriota bacterium]